MPNGSVLIWVQVFDNLIWIQTLCKGYQQTTKVAASKERLNIELAHKVHVVWWLSHMLRQACASEILRALV